jgi:hypothetical protein
MAGIIEGFHLSPLAEVIVIVKCRVSMKIGPRQLTEVVVSFRLQVVVVQSHMSLQWMFQLHRHLILALHK